MNLMLQLKSVNIVHYKKEKLLIQNWEKETDVNDFKKGIEESLKSIVKGETFYIISNTKNQLPITDNNISFAINMLTEFIEKGLKKMAFVCPNSLFTEILVNRFIKQSNFSNIKIFNSIEEAKKWILE